MTLKNNLYTIKASDVEKGTFSIELIPDSIIYEAHFPGHPITPGVCIIQIATELLGDIIKKELELKTISNAKFLSAINPEEDREIVYRIKKLTVDAVCKSVAVSFIVQNQTDKIYSKISLSYSFE